MFSDEAFELIEFVTRDVLGVEQALNHRRERVIEGVLERVKQFAALRLFACDGRAIDRELAGLLSAQKSLCHHAIHERADGGICPRSFLEEQFLDDGRAARFVVPDGLDDGPFGLGEFGGLRGHTRIISTSVENVNGILYTCRGSAVGAPESQNRLNIGLFSGRYEASN